MKQCVLSLLCWFLFVCFFVLLCLIPIGSFALKSTDHFYMLDSVQKSARECESGLQECGNENKKVFVSFGVCVGFDWPGEACLQCTDPLCALPVKHRAKPINEPTDKERPCAFEAPADVRQTNQDLLLAAVKQRLCFCHFRRSECSSQCLESVTGNANRILDIQMYFPHSQILFRD